MGESEVFQNRKFLDEIFTDYNDTAGVTVGFKSFDLFPSFQALWEQTAEK